MLQLDAGIGGGEAPICLGLVLVPAGLPGRNFPDERFFIRDAAVQALARQDAQFGFRHIEPTPVLGGVVPFEPLDQPSGFGRRESLVK